VAGAELRGVGGADWRGVGRSPGRGRREKFPAWLKIFPAKFQKFPAPLTREFAENRFDSSSVGRGVGRSRPDSCENSLQIPCLSGNSAGAGFDPDCAHRQPVHRSTILGGETDLNPRFNYLSGLSRRLFHSRPQALDARSGPVGLVDRGPVGRCGPTPGTSTFAHSAPAGAQADRRGFLGFGTPARDARQRARRGGATGQLGEAPS
jgi:hypothetical protein